VLEVVFAFLRGEGAEQFADFVPERWDGARCGFAQEGLEFCEGHFDGIEVWRVGRQIVEPGASRLDGLTHAGYSVVIVTLPSLAVYDEIAATMGEAA
jgi:hypothetical protein